MSESISVTDGESIQVELQPTGDCVCCITDRVCHGQQATPMWTQKSKKENKSFALNRVELIKKVKFITERLKKRR